MSRLAILTMRPINKLRQRQPVQAQPAPVVPAPEPEPVVVAAPEPEPVVALPEPEPVVVAPEPEPVVVAPEPEPVVIAPEPEPEEAPAIELTREMLNTKTKAELAKFGAEIGLDLDASAKKSELVNKIAASIGI
jgi:hypothetical protein